MAGRGTFTLFEKFADQIAQKKHNFKETDVFKLGLVDENVPVPVAGSATPTWGNFSGNEVDSVAGNYTADGITLTYAGVTRWEEAAGVGKFDADNITMPRTLEDSQTHIGEFYTTAPKQLIWQSVSLN